MLKFWMDYPSILLIVIDIAIRPWNFLILLWQCFPRPLLLIDREQFNSVFCRKLILNIPFNLLHAHHVGERLLPYAADEFWAAGHLASGRPGGTSSPFCNQETDVFTLPSLFRGQLEPILFCSWELLQAWQTAHFWRLEEGFLPGWPKWIVCVCVCLYFYVRVCIYACLEHTANFLHFHFCT